MASPVTGTETAPPALLQLPPSVSGIGEPIFQIFRITTLAPLRGASLLDTIVVTVVNITTHAPSRQTSQSIDSVLIGLGKLQLAPLCEGHHGRYRHKAPFIVLQFPPLCEGRHSRKKTTDIVRSITSPTPPRGASKALRKLYGISPITTHAHQKWASTSLLDRAYARKLQLLPLCERHFNRSRLLFYTNIAILAPPRGASNQV